MQFRTVWTTLTFERYGKDDRLGFLNRLTPEVVPAAAKEIKTGKRISLDWALERRKSCSMDVLCSELGG